MSKILNKIKKQKEPGIGWLGIIGFSAYILFILGLIILAFYK